LAIEPALLASTMIQTIKATTQGELHRSSNHAFRAASLFMAALKASTVTGHLFEMKAKLASDI